jgi:hypothetical protein
MSSSDRDEESKPENENETVTQHDEPPQQPEPPEHIPMPTPTPTQNPIKTKAKPKTLVLYVFHEFHARVQHFIDHAIFKDDSVDFIIICNNKNIVFDCPDYVRRLYRDNTGYDFGAWSDGLLTDDLYREYDHFIFVNSSVVGPFLPSYSANKKWTDIYLENLKGDVKLFGSTINSCIHYLKQILFHVQSYIFAMDKETLEYLFDCEIFSMTNNSNDYHEVILKKEIGMSQAILRNNWNIGSLLPHYRGADFRDPGAMRQEILDDIAFQQYYNVLWNEYDVVFVKGNRINMDMALKKCDKR